MTGNIIAATSSTFSFGTLKTILPNISTTTGYYSVWYNPTTQLFAYK